MPDLDFARKPNSAAAAFLVGGAVWFLVGTIYGAFSAIHLVAPEAFSNIPALMFGRARPVHVNTVIYGFVTSTLLGAALYYVPHLLKTKLWSQPLGWVSFVLWNVSVLSGPTVLPFGLSQGKEYAEYLWIFDVTLMLALLTLVANLVMTISRRQENTLYVSVWYAVGAAVWTAGVYPIGNVMWHPATGAVPGILDSIFLWFYGHNLVGLLLTPLAAGAAYFIIPRVTQTPLFSHTLSLFGFWTLVMLYTHIGGHHLLQAPIPTWLKTVSVIDSMAMFIPVTAVLTNIWMTSRGRLGSLWRDLPGRFVLFGTLWYLITCVQGPLQSLPSVQKVTHFSNWTIGHAHIAVLGFSGFIALGALWHVLPLATGRKVYSMKLVSLQFGLALVGITGFFLVLTAAGLIQGQAWRNGEGIYRTLSSIAPYMILRAAMGMFILSAAAVGLYNVIMTLRRGEACEPQMLREAQP